MGNTVFFSEEKSAYQAHLHKLSTADVVALINEINEKYKSSPEIVLRDRFFLFVFERQESILAQKVELDAYRKEIENKKEEEVRAVRGTGVTERRFGILPRRISFADTNPDSAIEKILKFFHPDHRERIKHALLSHLDGSTIKIRNKDISFEEFYSLVHFEYEGANKDRESSEPVYLGSGLFEKFLNGELSPRDLFSDGEVSSQFHRKLSSEKPNLDSIEQTLR